MKADVTEQYNKIYQYCYLRVHNRTLAEDLTQETFLRYFGQISDKKIQSLKPAAEIPVEKQLAYLYTIARNLCIDHFRRCGSDCRDFTNNEVFRLSNRTKSPKVLKGEDDLKIGRKPERSIEMTNRELKRKIKNAFPIQPSQQGQEFLQQMQIPQRRMKRLDFYLIQFGYIRKRIWLVSILLMALALTASNCLEAVSGNAGNGMAMLWSVSAIMPLIAVLTVTEGCRSLLYGMSEIEMSTRHNLSEIYLARTAFLGAGNFLLVLAVLPFVAKESQNMIFITAVYLWVPYLLTAVLTLEAAHRCGRNHLPVISLTIAVLISTGYLFLTEEYDVYNPRNTGMWILLFLVLLYLTGKKWWKMEKNLEEVLCS